MLAIRETCVAGKTIDRVIKVTSGNHKNKRAGRKNITSEKVQKNNDRLAIKNLMRTLNANFNPGDLHVVLTNAIAPTEMQAAKDRGKFIKELRKELKRIGVELKYVAVTEFLSTRIHHHIVVNTSDIELLQKVWGNKGWIRVTALDDSGNYIKLAEYLIKETNKTFRLPDSIHKRRYSCSRNLIKPIVKKEFIDISELSEDPKPIKGYYIQEEFKRRYEHPVTGLEHLEYIMVALDKPRGYKVWPNGVEVKTREYYKANYIEEQTDLCM